jgi:ubiquinone/menaquinone biosynthesis C-methylase UbiE
MTTASYDSIAEWYDEWLRIQPLFADVIIPAMLEIISATGDLRDRRICDLACGQGMLARQLAQRGAQMVGIDLSAQMLAIAQRKQVAAAHPIIYQQDDAQVGATLEDASFDGVVCNMALMDIPDLTATVRTVHRILRPGGWFIFSLAHPCVQMPHARWVTREDGTMVRESGDYFAEGFWRPTDTSGVRGRVGSYHRTISTYLNTLIQAGLPPEHLIEPQGSAALVQQVPGYQHVPCAFIARCRKA